MPTPVAAESCSDAPASLKVSMQNGGATLQSVESLQQYLRDLDEEVTAAVYLYSACVKQAAARTNPASVVSLSDARLSLAVDLRRKYRNLHQVQQSLLTPPSKVEPSSREVPPSMIEQVAPLMEREGALEGLSQEINRFIAYMTAPAAEADGQCVNEFRLNLLSLTKRSLALFEAEAYPNLEWFSGRANNLLNGLTREIKVP